MLHRLVSCAVAMLLLVTAARSESVTVRLIGGSDPRSGRLEVYRDGVWGTVCDDYFTDAGARVVCYMLGYGRSGRYVGKRYGRGSGTIWLDDVQCSGTETSIVDCPHSGWGGHYCFHNEDVSVSCVPDSAEAVALVGRGNPRVGRLEVFHGSQWGTVCDDGFTDAAARVVCYLLLTGIWVQRKEGGHRPLRCGRRTDMVRQRPLQWDGTAHRRVFTRRLASSQSFTPSRRCRLMHRQHASRSC